MIHNCKAGWQSRTFIQSKLLHNNLQTLKLRLKLHSDERDEMDRRTYILKNFDATVLETEEAGTGTQSFSHLVTLNTATTWGSLKAVHIIMLNGRNMNTKNSCKSKIIVTVADCQFYATYFRFLLVNQKLLCFVWMQLQHNQLDLNF